MRKAIDQLERQGAAKRGGGRLVGESAVAGGEDVGGDALDRIVGRRADARVRRDGGRAVPAAARRPGETTRCARCSTCGWRATRARRSPTAGLRRADGEAEAGRDPPDLAGEGVMSDGGAAGRRRPATGFRAVRRIDAACDRFEAAWRAGPGAADRGLPGRGAGGRPPGAAARAGGAGARAAAPSRRAAGGRGVSATGSRDRPRWSAPPSGARPRPDAGRPRTALRTPAATCSSASWPCRTTSSAATTCWPPSPPGSPTSPGRWRSSSWTAGRSTTPAARCWRPWSPSTSSSTAATPRRAWRRVSSLGSVRDDLERLDDADLQASLAATTSRAAGPATTPGATATYTSSSRRAGERFRILRFHREGGLGRVYVARDEELGREVALKEIRPDKAAEADLRGRFVLEAEINGGLEHPGIVPVYSLGTYDDGRPFYAMRFVEGDSLKEAIESYHKEHPRPDPSAVEFRKLLGRFIDVCEAIAFAHSKGVLHRDLKPHNVMLGRYGETLLIDWGLAKATGRREPAGPDAAGEATLVPPSGSGHAPTRGRARLAAVHEPRAGRGRGWSRSARRPTSTAWGRSSSRCLTGEPPVEGTTTEEVLDRARRGAIRSPRSLNPNVPRALEAVCLKALAPEPEDRYPTARALAEDVEHWLADEPVTAWREPLSARARRWARRHRPLVTAAAAAVLVALAGLGAVLAVQRGANQALAAKNGALDRANADLAKRAGRRTQPTRRWPRPTAGCRRGSSWPARRSGRSRRGRGGGGAEGGPAAAAAGQAAGLGAAVLRPAGRAAAGPARRRLEGGAGRVVHGARRADRQDRPEAGGAGGLQEGGGDPPRAGGGRGPAHRPGSSWPRRSNALGEEAVSSATTPGPGGARGGAVAGRAAGDGPGGDDRGPPGAGLRLPRAGHGAGGDRRPTAGAGGLTGGPARSRAPGPRAPRPSRTTASNSPTP